MDEICTPLSVDHLCEYFGVFTSRLFSMKKKNIQLNTGSLACSVLKHTSPYYAVNTFASHQGFQSNVWGLASSSDQPSLPLHRVTGLLGYLALISQKFVCCLLLLASEATEVRRGLVM